LTANYIAGSLPKLAITGAVISSIQATQPLQPGDWVACLKLTNGSYYAVFYAAGNIADFRTAVAIDRCQGAAGYNLLPPLETKKNAKKT
jgi:SAM-dependent MidA family methyltransferase